MSDLQDLPRRLLPPNVYVADLLYGFNRAQVLYTTSKLGIPDALAEGPLSPAALSHRVGARYAVVCHGGSLGLYGHWQEPGRQSGKGIEPSIGAWQKWRCKGSLPGTVRGEGGGLDKGLQAPPTHGSPHSKSTGGTMPQL